MALHLTHMVASTRTGCGVSSFGYSGTIVHAILRAEVPAGLQMCLPVKPHAKRRFCWSSSTTDKSEAAFPAIMDHLMDVFQRFCGSDVDIDMPISDMGLDSLSAAALRSEYQEVSHATLPTSLGFDSMTLRQLTCCNGMPDSSRSSFMSATSSKHSTIGQHFARTGPGLVRLNEVPHSNAVVPLLFVFGGPIGHPTMFQPLAEILNIRAYGVIHPYLQRGVADDLEAPSVRDMAILWATSMGVECRRLGCANFSLFGVSVGCMFGHEIALSSVDLGMVGVGRMVLVDPVPVLRPWKYRFPVGLKYAAEVIAHILIANACASETGKASLIVDRLQSTPDDELGILLAELRTSLGFSPFDETTVKERYRELRAVSHLLHIWDSFLAQPNVDGVQIENPVLLILARDREEFFTSVFNLSEGEASKDAIRRYCSNVVHELVLEGGHFDAVSWCLSANKNSFLWKTISDFLIF